MVKSIPAVGVHFSNSDREEILSRIDRCLATGYVSQGANVEEFEANFASYMGTRHAVAVCSGGAALEAAMRALDVAGKEVLLPTNTFFATAAAVLAAGGRIKLVDIDAHTLAPSVESIARALGPDVAGLIVVHIGGIISHDLDELRKLCDRHRLWLFEDCAHAHGSELDGKRAGTFGIGGAYSMFSTKVITSGEGGIFLTNEDWLADQVRLLRDYGKPSRWISYSVQFGLNWRLNELAAIVGIAQLRRLDEFIDWRAKIAAIYDRELAADPILTRVRPSDRSSWYKYIVKLPGESAREPLKAYMRERGVAMPGGVYDLPLHRQPVFGDQFDGIEFPVADDFCARHICLPIYYGLEVEDARYVAQSLRAFFDSSSRDLWSQLQT